MATNYIYLSGTAKWIKAQKPDEKYNKYTLDLYLDETSKANFEKSGLRLQTKTDETGSFVKFSREHNKLIKDENVIFGPPKVLNPDGTDFAGLIGNGSKVTIKVAIYDTVKGLGHRWEAVRWDELIKYERPQIEGSAPETGLPF